MTVAIRRGTSADSVALKACDSIVPGDPQRAQLIDRWLEKDTVLVAELDGRVVGYGVFNHAFFHRGQVEMLMVDPAHRGRKIGEALLRELEALCDTEKFFVTTNLSNQAMQRLLARCKFKNCGFIDELDPGDPELVFFKAVWQR
jgi:ribosomal protein S18 acetylase RimI-like enzyme